MAQLTLTDEEREALVVLLEGGLSNLSYEIADTDRSEFRDQIKARRDVLRRILENLKKTEA